MAFHPLRGVFVEFRAGKMLLDGTRVVPDNRKGLFRMGMGEDRLYHIQWLDRSLNVIESDQIIFPGKAVFEKAIQSSERVYILKFLEDDRNFFFWMQEPKADKDAELCTVVNFLLKMPLDVDAIFSRAIDMLNRSMGAEATSDVTSTGPVQRTDLQPIPKNIVSSGVVESVDPDAGDMLTPENVRQRYPQLTSYVPENGEWTTAEFIKVLKNPAYRQELDSFTNDVGAGQVDLTQYLVDPSKKISDNHTVSSLLEALEDYIAECDPKSQAPDGSDGSDEGDILKPENVRHRYPQLESYVPENGEWTLREFIQVLQNPAYRQELDSFTNDVGTGQVDLNQYLVDPSTKISDNYTVSSFLEALKDYIAQCERSAKEGSDSKSQARDGSDGSDEGGDAKEDEPDVSVPVKNSEDMDEDAIFSRTFDMLSRSMGAEATSDVTSAGPVQLKDLQSILRNIVSSGVVESVDPDEDLGLGDILNPDYVWPLVRGLRSRQQLAPYLPKGRWTPAKLREMLENPPFRQQLDSFTCSLRSGQVDLTQFGIDPSTQNVTVSSFLEALEDSVARTRESEGSAKGGSDSKSQARDGSDSKGQ